jgi:multidrug efflux pump subunit AcrA (membrane-fusion protein)
VASVEVRDVAPETDHIGRVEAVGVVDVRAPVSGLPARGQVREDTDVKAGDLLFEIETREHVGLGYGTGQGLGTPCSSGAPTRPA